MIGLLVLGALVLWFAAAGWFARRLARAIPMKPNVRPWVSVVLFVLVFLLPVADEVAARPYFGWLCRNGAALRINAEKIRGRSLVLSVDPSHARIRGTTIPIFHSHYLYRDTQTGEVLAEYELYSAQGGMLANWIGVGGAHPITGDFFCAPEDRVSMMARYGFNVVN